jgi:sulfur transfer protein SufE
MESLGNWTDRFNYFIAEGEYLPENPPNYLLQYRIEGCQSRTYYKVWLRNNRIHSSGWSNSGVMGGIIVSIIKIFNGAPVEEMQGLNIDFHTQSGLIDNLTPMRQATLSEIIRRITVLSPTPKINEI